MEINIEKIRETKPIKELLKFAIINIDKPTGPTSFTISNYIKLSLNAVKTSHFGTLDPMVTGVLPVALGRACRLNDYFMHRDKTYVGIMRLHEDIPDKQLKEELKNFIGVISQLPPVRSSVKRALREREIKRFEILEREGKDILFLAEVQAGTYIRKLIHDLGEKIGGAHMLELRRTQAGIFTEEKIVNMYDFDKAIIAYLKGDEKLLRKILVPAEIIAKILPVLQVNAKSIKQMLTGKPLMKTDIMESMPKDAERIALFNKDNFIGVYKIVKEKEIIGRSEFILN